MKKCLLILAALTPLYCYPIQSAGENLLFNQEDNADIIVNNRILAKINGKPISVIDLVKKMDILFYKQFPEYTSSTNARYQFYKANWRHVLQDLIDKELVLADAEENKFNVNSGDVRQEMESMFGPNVIANLDKVGMTFEEAWKIVHGDITIRRMIYVRVHGKAMRKVTPQSTRAAYEHYVKEHAKPEEFTYRVISIRAKDEAQGVEIANEAYRLLTEENVSATEITDHLNRFPLFTKETSSVNVSEEMKHTIKEVSESYRTILSKLKPTEFSPPSAQKSRADRGMVFRIFYLKDFNPGGAPPYAEVEGQIKDKLLNEALAVETDAYLLKLRKHFAVKETVMKEMIPDDFQPFILKVSRFK